MKKAAPTLLLLRPRQPNLIVLHVAETVAGASALGELVDSMKKAALLHHRQHPQRPPARRVAETIVAEASALGGLVDSTKKAAPTLLLLRQLNLNAPDARTDPSLPSQNVRDASECLGKFRRKSKSFDDLFVYS
jgi:hypothetical protein